MLEAQNTNAPVVTVGIAVYNHEDFIVECIQSVLNQTYDNIQLIIIDDGSKDNSFNEAKSCIDNYQGAKNISCITRPNKGMCNTLNEIAHQAEGKYISFIGSDDFWATDKIDDQVNYLESHSDLALVHSNSMKVDANSYPIKPIDYSKKENSGHLFEALIRRTGGINTPSHLYRTEVYKKIGYYDPKFSFEDTDFWLRLTKEFKVGFINKIHSYYRWHGKNLSDGANALTFYYDELIAIYKKNIDDSDLLKESIKIMNKKKASKLLQAGKYWQGIKQYFKA